MVLPPAQKKLVADGKKATLVSTKAEPADMDQTADFPVPKTTPLDTSAIRDRPKHKNRPPTNRNAHHANHEEDAVKESAPSEDSDKNLSPWKTELMTKKKQPNPAKLSPKPGNKPKPAVAIAKPDMSPVTRSRLTTRGSSPSSKTKFNHPPMTTRPKTTVATPAATSSATAPNKAFPPITKPTAATPLAMVLNKTIPPVAKPATTPVETPTKTTFPPLSKPAEAASKPHKPVETKPPHTSTPITSEPPPSTHSSSTTNDGLPPSSTPAPIVPSLPNNAWKEAIDKLREDFIKFKAQMVEKIDILTDDLDRERKNRASLEIDIDRLKKAQRSLVN